MTFFFLIDLFEKIDMLFPSFAFTTANDQCVERDATEGMSQRNKYRRGSKMRLDGKLIT